MGWGAERSPERTGAPISTTQDRRSWTMLAGIVLVIAGILIAVYPPLLSIIVALLLILLGIVVLTVTYYERKAGKHSENPVIELFLRF
jgi:uncharacterized membrane protein HdeD (DUF308 family)